MLAKVINDKTILSCPMPFYDAADVRTIHSDMLGMLFTQLCFSIACHYSTSIESITSVIICYAVSVNGLKESVDFLTSPYSPRSIYEEVFQRLYCLTLWGKAVLNHSFEATPSHLCAPLQVSE
jgi:hypothetical protein